MTAIMHRLVIYHGFSTPSVESWSSFELIFLAGRQQQAIFAQMLLFSKNASREMFAFCTTTVMTMYARARV